MEGPRATIELFNSAVLIVEGVGFTDGVLRRLCLCTPPCRGSCAPSSRPPWPTRAAAALRDSYGVPRIRYLRIREFELWRRLVVPTIFISRTVV
jgi:hypothetical protein